ncbi:YeiH family protein [Ornithinimicrobium avium]|nr:putative sulfate exporter family transporter [Ornithinimicrobium avium]
MRPQPDIAGPTTVLDDAPHTQHKAPLWPGLLACLAAALVALGIQQLVPGLSALLVAILLGVAVAHAVALPRSLQPGIAVSGKRLLRLGIVLLGFQLALDDILALGWGTIAVVVAVVSAGLVGTVLVGRRLGLTHGQSVLIAAGFSICGAAAVAAVEGSVEREDEDVATAIALVVVFGTLMIGVVPAVLALTGLPLEVKGMIAGGSIHEVAQVVAAGGIIGGGALATAVLVKLARVLMLAPVVTVLGLLERRHAGEAVPAGAKRPPLVPLFVVGFLAAALLRTVVPLPDLVLDAAHLLQVLLLSAAMFALGLGVHVSMLKAAGARPFVLGAFATVLVSAVATTGFLLVA